MEECCAGYNFPNPLKWAKSALYSREITYGYSSTRVRARKALILQKAFFEDLLNQRTLDGISAMLERTYYKDILTSPRIAEYSKTRSPSEVLEFASEIHYKDVVNKVRSFTPDDGLPVVNMLMRKWDILNLRTIISSRRTGRSWEDIFPYLVSAGELSVPQLKQLASCEPEKLYVRIRSTRVGRELLSHSGSEVRGTELEGMFLRAVKSAQTLGQLQVLLDAGYYNYLQQGIVSSDRDVSWIRATVSKEIDLRNIMAVLRMKQNGASEYPAVAPHMIRGGRLTPRDAEALLSAKTKADTLSAIRKFFRLEQADFESLPVLEVLLQQALARERVKIFYRNPVSIATIAGFLFIKEEEMNNLRKIVRGKDYNLSPQEIRPMLVYY